MVYKFSTQSHKHPPTSPAKKKLMKIFHFVALDFSVIKFLLLFAMTSFSTSITRIIRSRELSGSFYLNLRNLNIFEAKYSMNSDQRSRKNNLN